MSNPYSRDLDNVVKIETISQSWQFFYNLNGWFKFTAVINLSLWSKNLGHPYSYSSLANLNTSPKFNVNQINSVELIIDSVPVSTFSRAVVGSLMFGGAGAIAGALSGINAKPKSKIAVAIFLNNIELSSVTIPCKNLSDANRLISTISNLEALNTPTDDKLEVNPINTTEKITDQKQTITDEIMKLKKMLDDGIIDQEEFKTFKKKLME